MKLKLSGMIILVKIYLKLLIYQKVKLDFVIILMEK